MDVRRRCRRNTSAEAVIAGRRTTSAVVAIVVVWLSSSDNVDVAAVEASDAKLVRGVALVLGAVTVAVAVDRLAVLASELVLALPTTSSSPAPPPRTSNPLLLLAPPKLRLVFLSTAPLPNPGL